MIFFDYKSDERMFPPDKEDKGGLQRKRKQTPPTSP